MRLLAALAATSEKMLYTADVKGAYLTVNRETAEGHKPLWLKPPEGYEHPENPRLMLRILTCFYGLRDSGRRWFMHFRKAIEKISFKSVDHDPCMWVRDAKAAAKGERPNINNPDYALLGTWVDDSIILSSEREFQRIVEDLKGQGIDIDKASQAEKFVGVDINIRALRVETRNNRPVEVVTVDNINQLRSYAEDERMVRPRVELTIRNVASKEREVLLTQKQYIVDTFRDCGAPEKPCVQTPVPKGWVVDRRTMPKVPNKENVAYFRRIYGKVLHIMRCTRPDIAYPVSELGRVAASPSDEHIRILKRVCQYLYNTRGLGLRFGGASVREKRNERNRIKVKVMQDFVPAAYADASWACDPADRRSMGGYVIFLNGSAVAWRAKRQSFAVGSTCESEIMALSSVVREVQAMTRALVDMGIMDENSPPVVVYEDNACCIAHCNEDISHGRTKALDLRYVIARDAVQRRIIDVKKAKSKEQLADFMCKMPEKQQFINMRDAVLGMTIKDLAKEDRTCPDGICRAGDACACSPKMDNAEARARAREQLAQQGARAGLSGARGSAEPQRDARASKLSRSATEGGASARWLPWW